MLPLREPECNKFVSDCLRSRSNSIVVSSTEGLSEAVDDIGIEPLCATIAVIIVSDSAEAEVDGVPIMATAASRINGLADRSAGGSEKKRGVDVYKGWVREVVA